MADERLPVVWAWVLGLGWPVAFGIAGAVAPPPADPDAAPSALGVLIAYAILGGVVGVVAGAVRRTPRTLVWSAALGGILLVDSVLCPVTGHHTIGLWWGTQFVLFSALLAATGMAALARRPR